MANQKHPKPQGPNKPENKPNSDRQRQHEGSPTKEPRPGERRDVGQPGREGDHERDPMAEPGQPRRDHRDRGKGDMGRVVSNPDELEPDELDDDDRITQRNPKLDQPKPMKP